MASGAVEVLIQLFAVYVAAKAFGWAGSLVRIPSVVGEIAGGVVLANTFLAESLRIDGNGAVLPVLAELGVVFLIFSVGLETPFEEMRRVGRTSAIVAVLGVVLPFGGGYALSAALGWPVVEGLFLGAALVATSVGITARVLADLGALGRPEARIILGAAVIDDVLGITALTVVQAIGSGGALSVWAILWIVVQALVFVGLLMWLGGRVARRALSVEAPWARRFGWSFDDSSTFGVAVVVCLGLAAFAAVIGLAAIIGAFVAGMAFAATERRHGLAQSFEGVVQLLAPFFFGYIGLQLDLGVARDVLWVALGVTALAMATKLVGCGVGALGMGPRSATAIGIGMAPRGEVGIVVALVGLTVAGVPASLYAIVVTMSILTTVVTPPLLVWSFRRLPPPQARP